MDRFSLRALLLHFTTLVSGESLARLAGLALAAILARSLGVEGYGVISLGMTVALIAGTMIDVGQTAHASRIVAADASMSWPVVRVVARNKALLTFVACACVAAGLRAAGLPASTVAVAVVMTVWAGVLGVFDTGRALLRATGRIRYDATMNFGESALRLLLCALAAVALHSVVGVSWAFVAEASIAAALLAVMLSRTRVPAKESARPLEFLRSSAPIGAAAVALALFYRVDQVFVASIAGASANGVYGAAARLAFTGTVAAQLVVAAAFPTLAALRKDPSEFRSAYRRVLLVCVAVSGVVALVMALLAGPIVLLLYGRGFEGAVPMLRVLALVVLLNGLSYPALYSGIALGRERTTLALILTLTPLVLFAYVLAVSAAGGMGAAWVSVAAELALAVGLVAVSGRALIGGEDQ